jgi:ribonuclease R
MAKAKADIKAHLKKSIQDIFTNDTKSTLNYKQVAKILGSTGAQHRKFITGVLYQLAKEGLLIEPYKGKFQASPLIAERRKSLSPIVTGKVDMKQTGKAYVITEDMMEDIRISANFTGRALHNDIVRVRLFPGRKDKKQEGEIIEVLERSKDTYVGTIQMHKNNAFLIASSKSMPVDIFIQASQLKEAKDGDKVLVKISDWPAQSKNPYGEIITVFGRPGENDVEMHAILAEYGLPAVFPANVEAEAEDIPSVIDAHEIASRRDFRDILTFTIDPLDAKDFDDALSVLQLDENLWEIGVHIADVTHFVKPGSLIEQEAIERATSIYLVDRTIPMLPERLSNFLCSLRPEEEKLTYSAVFQINDHGKVIKSWIGKTIIKSNKRFTYEDVQTIIEEKQGLYYTEIDLLNKLAKKLREKRLKMGAIDFDRQEIKFLLDDQGKPTGVYLKEQKDAHKLIEEFMLLANRTVAEKTGKPTGKKPPNTFVYRIHDLPNLDKLNILSTFVSKLGYKLKTDTRKNISETFNRMLHDSQGKGEEQMIETLSLRTMAKAAYSTNNIGHYGLAFDFYTHFTSPIRRYPDMMVHRLLYAYSQGEKSVDQDTYELMCKHASEMEVKAQEAERDSVKYKQVEFMSDKIGLVFDGLISGVSKWGIYVQIKENKIEGMIRLKDLEDDYYFLDEDNYQVIGQNKKKVFKLGNSIQIRIKRADFLKRELDFVLA